MSTTSDDMEGDRRAMGERLRQAREYLGFSQEEVAKYLNISRSALSNIETGQRKVDALELKKLASLYKRPVTHFTGDSCSSANDAALRARLPGRPPAMPRFGPR